MQTETSPQRGHTGAESPTGEPLTALPTIVGFGVGVAFFLIAAIGSWRHRARRLRAFHAAASVPCRPNRWPPGDDRARIKAA